MSPGKDQRETVLVVEDDAGIAELEQMQLERAGFTVVTAATPGDALDRLRRHPVDLILLDYRLPGDVDGLDVYLEWKAMGFDLPVILVTGFSNEAVAIRALRAGVRDLITKSAEYLDYLPEAVERVLKQVRTERRLAESEARLSSIIDSANDAIIIAETGLKITLFNQAAEAMFRCPAGQALGQPVSHFITEEDPPGTRTGCRRFPCRSGTVDQLELLRQAEVCGGTGRSSPRSYRSRARKSTGAASTRSSCATSRNADGRKNRCDIASSCSSSSR